MPAVLNQPPFGVSLNSQMEKVEIIQHQAALSITSAWESLSDRRMCRRILQIHKIINEKTPSYLNEKLPPNHRPFFVSVFREVICRTNRYSHSFLPVAIASWNRIITDFEDFPSLYTLKRHVISRFRPKPKRGLYDPLIYSYKTSMVQVL